MNIYNFDVNFTTGRIYAPDFILVVNDHNSTLFKFTFDQVGRYVFKLLYPDGTIYVQDIMDNQLKLTKGVLNQEGNYKFEISLYGEDNRLTTARIKEFPVRLELVSTDEPVQADDRLPILDNLIEETNKVVEAAKNGEFDGATFTPSVSDNGDLSWTNDKGKENPPTVNIKGEKGDPGAVKMQVVDTLPDVGETDTIYLVKKNNPGEQNLYDEYVYTETSGWEHIGDTSVDLTDYYTKEETNERLNNKQDTLTAGDNITIENNVISASGGKSELYTFYTGINYGFNRPNNIYQSAFSADKRNMLTTMLGNIITDTMTTDNKAKMLLLTFDCNNVVQGLPYLLFTFGSNQKLDTSRNTYRMVSIPNGIYNRILYTYYIDIQGSWENNVFSVSSWQMTKNNEFEVLSTDTGLSKTNTKAYTPTGDYNPATKKYVDDNKYTLPVASAETLGGIKLGEGLSADENGVVSVSGGKGISNAFPIYSFRVLNTASMLTGSMNVTANSEIELTTISNIINNALTANVDKFAIFVGTSATASYSRDLVPFTIAANLSNNPTRIVGEGYHIYANPNDRYSGSECARLVRGAIIIQGEWANDKFTATSMQIFSTNSDTYSLAEAPTVLVKTNTYTYVPTGDYNPSTKLYTDKTHYENMTGYDATKTQVLKNINGTLTWVDEV